MNKHLQVSLLFLIACAACPSLAGGENWTAFRGSGNAVSEGKSPPTDIAENIAWKADLPGRGPSSPIVVGDYVIVTASSGARGERLHVIAFDKESGKKAWHRQFWATGHTYVHPSSANAANTPCSDGKLVFAFYSSNDLVCLDKEGRFKWFRGLAFDHPNARIDVGMSSSPIVIGDVVICQVENQGESFAAGINKLNGTTVWRIRRTPRSNWSSPVAVSFQGKPCVLLQSADRATLNDAATGKELWRYEAEHAPIPSSIAVQNKLFLPAKGITCYDMNSAEASAPEFCWESNRLGPGTASPVIHQGKVYVAKSSGVLTAASAETGGVDWQIRLKGPFWSTPIASKNCLYLLSGDGLVQVLDITGSKGKLVSEFDLEQTLQATPAVSDGALYIRSDKHLWKIAASR